MAYLSPCNMSKTDFSHWDRFQGSSKESFLQIGSSESGHSPWPTVGDWLHQQPEVTQWQWKASG